MPFAGKEVSMQDILKEYGPAIITVIAVAALVAVLNAIIGTDGSSVVGKAFSELITGFFAAVPPSGGA